MALTMEEAVARGDRLALEALHEAGAPLTPGLMRDAVARGDAAMVDLLSKRGVAIDPELVAVAFGRKHLRVVDLLAQRGSALGEELMRAASGQGWLRGVKFLHRRGVSFTVDTVVVPAIDAGSVPVLTYAHENGLDITPLNLRAYEIVSDPKTAPLVTAMAKRGFGESAAAVAPLAEALAKGDEARARAAIAEVDRLKAHAYLAWRAKFRSGTPSSGDAIADELLKTSSAATWIRSSVVGDVKHIAQLLRVDESFRTADGPRALRQAAANGQLAVLRELLEGGVALDGVASDACVLAAANGRLECLTLLAEAGADLSLNDWAAGRAALRERHVDVLSYLHERGLPLAQLSSLLPDLTTATRSREVIEFYEQHTGHVGALTANAVAAALRGGDKARIDDALAAHPGRFACPELLALAAEVGNAKAARSLLARVPDLSEAGIKALVAASGAGHLRIVKLLVARSVPADGASGSALKVASENGRIGVVKFLMNAGVPVSRTNGRSLAMTRFNGHLLVHDTLTGSGADGIAEHRAGLEAMQANVEAGPAIWRPSARASELGAARLEGLRRVGIERFKRVFRDPGAASETTPRVDPPDLGGDAKDRLVLLDESADYTVRQPSGGAWSAAFRRRGQRVARARYRAATGAEWTRAVRHDRLGLADRVSEIRIGSPTEVWLGDRLISSDLATSILEANTLLEGLPDTLIEKRPSVLLVGGGYGRLAQVLAEGMGCRVTVVDVSPDLYVAQHYLGLVLTGRSIFRFRPFASFASVRAEFEAAEGAFLTPDQLALLPDATYDLGVYTDPAGIREVEQARAFASELGRLVACRVYAKDTAARMSPLTDDLREKDQSWTPDLDRVAIGGRDLREFRWTRNPVAGAARKAPSRREPTVALLLANYNDARYLHTSLEACLAQTRPFDDILIVDDGSNDGTAAVVAAFSLRDPRVRLLLMGWRRGQHQAIQRAICETACDYVVWAASDDLLLPHFLETNLRALAAMPEAGLSFSRLSTWIDGTDKNKEYSENTDGPAFDLGQTPRRLPRKELLAKLRKHYVWISGNTVVARRRALLEQGGFEQSLRWHADWFGFYVIALRYGAIGVPQTLAMMRERPDTYSAAGRRRRSEQMRVLGAIVDFVHAAKYYDLRDVFRSSPAMLSLYGTSMFRVLASRPRQLALTRRLLDWHRPTAERWLRERIQKVRGSALVPAAIRRMIGYELDAGAVQELWRLFGEGRREDVVSAIDQAFRSGARGGVLHYLRGMCLHALRVRLDEARLDFDRSLKLGVDRAWVLTNRGRLRLESGDAGGRQDLLEAISYGGSASQTAREHLRSEGILVMWAALFQGRHSDALALAEDMIQQGRPEPELRYVAGLCLQDTPSRYAEGVHHHTAAIEGGLEPSWPLLHRGRLRLRLGDECGWQDIAAARELGGDAGREASDLLDREKAA